jgi:hypothetical protein
MSDDEMSSDMPTKIGDPPGIDDEIDEFAESAFDALMTGGDGKKAAEPQTAVEPAEGHTGEYEDVELDDVIMVSDAPAEEAAVFSTPPSAPPPSTPPSAPPPSSPPSSVASAPPAASEVPVTSGVEVARLRSEISELKAKLAETAGGVSSRQFLDLREALNKKDKEILELRDQLTARDKEILDLRDQSIELERSREDLNERSAGLERSLSKAQEAIASLSEDKENANKRYEDVKGRFEREKAKAQALEGELGKERQARAADVEALKNRWRP